MANDLVRPEQFFLNRFGMNESGLERILGNALERKADYADLYFEYRSAEGLGLEESMVNHTNKSVSHGVGVRVCAEDRTGYAYSDEVTFDRTRFRSIDCTISKVRRSTCRSRSVQNCSAKSTNSRAPTIPAFAT